MAAAPSSMETTHYPPPPLGVTVVEPTDPDTHYTSNNNSNPQEQVPVDYERIMDSRNGPEPESALAGVQE